MFAVGVEGILVDGRRKRENPRFGRTGVDEFGDVGADDRLFSGDAGCAPLGSASLRGGGVIPAVTNAAAGPRSKNPSASISSVKRFNSSAGCREPALPSAGLEATARSLLYAGSDNSLPSACSAPFGEVGRCTNSASDTSS
jgi:hypothetical protein